ncbi:helix-turn-helix domain-containing protein [Ktedonobacter racemifer]|uniref:Transcriptional regulator, XRE family n=1 Tax=Ktedonobacter racemifer DSM 44963 TaxID=485913 RepID=D6TQ60_KTERA|nr:helix-turn-helix domain-containing protein [Ktedonobacter racemifer]EFH85708.1 transcriptional regulator, XRE family [Ktedonobacter racemifer DSM 44963]
MGAKHTGWQLRVRETAEAQQLDREGLAARSGLPLETISPLWEDERADTSVATLAIIAKALHVPLLTLLQDAPEERSAEEA